MADYQRHFYPSACGSLELFARIYPGGGAPLMLLHGLTRNSADFEPLVCHLGKRHQLIVPDQRGRGLSANDPEPANYLPHVYVQDMFALLRGLDIASAGVIGTSMGGLMGMMMGVLRPDVVSGLVVNDIGPELDPVGLARIAGYVGPPQPFADMQAAADRCAQINGDAFPDFTAPDWLDFARRTCRQRADGQVEFAYDPAIADGFAGAGEAAQPDLWPMWQQLDALPVLLLRGDLSDLLSAATAQRMQQTHSGPFERVEVAGRGHAPLLNEPEAIDAIDRFLAQHLS